MTARKLAPRQVVPAWLAPPVTKAEASAIRALAKGEADEVQQKRALQWIVQSAANIGDLPYRPGTDGDRETVFACGRQFVGLQITRLVNMSGEQLEKLSG